MDVFQQKLIRSLENIEKAIKGTKRRFTLAHICNKKDLKPYAAVACSMCQNREEAIELFIDENNYKKLEKLLTCTM
jgi:hypothetical protein